MLASLGKSQWLKIFKTIYLKNFDVQFGLVFYNPYTYFQSCLIVHISGQDWSRVMKSLAYVTSPMLPHSTSHKNAMSCNYSARLELLLGAMQCIYSPSTVLRYSSIITSHTRGIPRVAHAQSMRGECRGHAWRALWSRVGIITATRGHVWLHGHA